MWRRSTQEERFAAADAIKARVKRGEITQQEGMYETAVAIERFALRDARAEWRGAMVLVGAVAVLVFVALKVANAEPAREAVCRYCHPVACLTSAFCGEGCTCLKTDGASSGQCVPR